ncbi:hypothetical protein CCYA_CCYA03G0865 [Cyanidiococcus yangmingshanensis]|nr:hypothetical protein CCYA_CCYA03G0865 [Cyanidiococcus yangmingshanensis]
MTEVGHRATRLTSALAELERPQQLERERAVDTLKALLPLHPLELSLVLKRLDSVLGSEGASSWMRVAGALTLAAVVLSWERRSSALNGTVLDHDPVHVDVAYTESAPEQYERSAVVRSSQFHGREALEALLDLLQATTPTFLVDEESVVRSAAVHVLTEVVAQRGLVAWSRLVPLLLSQIEEQLVQSRRCAATSDAQNKSTIVYHETFALKSCLEAVAACMHVISVADVVPSLILARSAFLESGVLASCMNHPNRFIRETQLDVLRRLIELCVRLLDRPEGQILENRQLVDAVVRASAPLIARGLDDNWSQVRYAGILTAQQLYRALIQTPLTYRIEVDRVLLPRLCLNRHYLAEGVREHARKTWQSLFSANGRELVIVYLADMVPYFVTQSQADNHGVREASCHVMAEIASRLDPCLVQPYLGELFAALMACFHDDSWPVRDCASSACATLASIFGLDDQPEEAIDELFALWFRHCADHIPSVRAHAAEAVARVGAQLQGSHLERVFDYLCRALPRATEQKPDNAQEACVPTSTVTRTTFDALKRTHDNDVGLHSNQTMYSCGSLAPKMRARHQRVGCMDCTYTREPEPWECTDGALYLWRHLAERGCGERCAENGILVLILVRLIELPVFHRLPALWATLWTQFALALPYLPPHTVQELLPTIRESMAKTAQCEQQHVLIALDEMKRALQQWEQAQTP